jgi:hypothetical protein
MTGGSVGRSRGSVGMDALSAVGTGSGAGEVSRVEEAFRKGGCVLKV